WMRGRYLFACFSGSLYLLKHLTRLHNLRHLVIEVVASYLTLNVYIVNSEKWHSWAELRHLNMRGKES
ncbi:hypothetical protein HN51_053500, partial [Arachis hypogaea]